MIHFNKSFWVGMMLGIALSGVFGIGVIAGVAKVEHNSAEAKAAEAQRAHDRIAHHSL